MSQPTATAITPRHYQALCGLALAAMFLLQMQQNILLFFNLMMLALGALAILRFASLSPVLVLVALAGGQLFDQHQQNGFFDPDHLRSYRSLNINNVLFCMATLTYLIGHYRLYGLRFGVLPFDARQGSAAVQARSVETLSAVELASLVIPIPLCALLADFTAVLLRQPWTVVGYLPREKQLLTIGWAVLLALFVAAHGFRYWRRLQMDRATALLLLQDVVWNETRGEQRQLNRWIVWKKLKQWRGDS